MFMIFKEITKNYFDESRFSLFSMKNKLMRLNQNKTFFFLMRINQRISILCFSKQIQSNINKFENLGFNKLKLFLFHFIYFIYFVYFLFFYFFYFILFALFILYFRS
jgi:hypothetical protein